MTPRIFDYTLLRRAVTATFLVFVSVALTLGLIEGALRLFPALLPEDVQLQLLRKTDTTDAPTIPDPYIGYRNPPNRVMTHHSRDFDVRVRTDEEGFRNESPWPSAADVVIVGDSLSYGYGVDDAHAWPMIVARSLRPSRLINLSLPGTGPLQYERSFEKFGVPLHPKLLLFSIFSGNDAKNTRSFEDWLAAGSPGAYSVWRDVRPAKPHSLRNELERSYLVRALWSARKNLRARLQQRTLDFPDGGRIQLVPAPYDREVKLITDRDRGFTGIAKAVASTKAVADRLGIHMLVVLFPTKEEVYLPLHGYPYPDLVIPIRDSLKDAHVEILDLTDDLRNAARGGSRWYFEVDGHPNELGNQLIAERVLEHIRANLGRYGLSGTLQINSAASRHDGVKR